MKFCTFGNTDKGKVRSENEDMFLVHEERKVYAVADGLGGLPGGKEASNMTIAELEEAISGPRYPDPLDYERLFNFINRKVHAEGRKISEEIGIGSTLTALQLNGRGISIGHVGDCVVFLFRDRDYIKITTDHTMAAEMKARLEPGQEAYIPEYFSHTLTRCLGQQGGIEVDVYHQTLKEGDRLLICSDGITKTQSEEELLNEVWRSETPEDFIDRIIEVANERGGPDNSTGVAIYVE